MMEADDNLIEVLAIIPQYDVWERFLQAAGKEGFRINQEADFKQGRNIIKREGYRFRIVLIDVGIADNVTDWIAEVGNRYPWLVFALHSSSADLASKEQNGKDVAKAMKNLMVDATAQTLVNFHGGTSDPESVSSSAMRLLKDARSRLDGRIAPPYLAGETHFLAEAGPLLFSISRTKMPWELEGDVFTLPVSNTGKLGDLGIAWKKSLGTPVGRKLQELAKNKASQTPILAKSPVKETFTYTDVDRGETRTIKLILATSATAQALSVMSAVAAHLAVIDLAASLEDCKTLVLPIIGGGSAGLPPAAIVRGVLEEFDPKSPLGDLKHVILTVLDSDVIEAVTRLGESEIAQVQPLENDVPSGPDRLRIESETRALADAIALKQMHPPLVVGILGGWGTGKSFVLHLIKERLSQLRSWDLTEDAVREQFPYVGHPYLVCFDAWTYAKSDLWASLMQRILLDLDQQLNLERTLEGAKGGILRQGVDIWRLLEDLTAKQIAELQEELGAEAIAAFEGWKKGASTAPSLWGVLQTLRHQELKDLNDAKQKLAGAESMHEQAVAAMQARLDAEIASNHQALELELTQKNSQLQIQIAEHQAALETARQTALAQTDAEIQAAARNAAWQPAIDELKAFLGKSVDKALAAVNAEDGETPLSIFSVIKEVKLTTKYARGLAESKSGIAFLVFALLSPALAWGMAHFNVAGLLSSMTGAAGMVGGLLGSCYASLTKLNQAFEDRQAAYQKSIEEARRKRQAQHEELLQQKLASTVLPIETSMQQLETTAKTETTELEATIQSQILQLRTKHLQELDALEKKHQELITGLNAEVEMHQRRAGITGRSKSLLDLVQARRDSKYYDTRLGLLHQVQEDLQELTDALLPVNGFDWESFPRGQPRIILIVDDLDRCPPDQVVRMLEAAQLLVRTKLFVVVLAMDVRYVTRALEKDYEGILFKDGDPSGLDYVEKIVQVPYRVPGIAPGVMRSYLQGQMDVVVETAEPSSSGLQAEGDQETLDTLDIPNGNPVFESTFDPEAPEVDEPLPTRVQQFDEEELSLMTACCNAATVSPRAGRRLVNVFKLLKIIWYHRGLHREPSYEIKRVMMFMLTLSSAQPLIMRHVLQFLEEEYRKGNTAQKFTEALDSSLKLSEKITKQPQTHKQLKELIESQGSFSSELTLEMIDLDNVRLVKSFSFVGEVESEKQARDDSNLKKPAEDFAGAAETREQPQHPDG